METALKELMITESQKLIAAPSCSPEAKNAAKAWLAAVGTDCEDAETEKYLNELKEDLVTIDGLIVFAESDAGKTVFGSEQAASEVASHARTIKAQGAAYCDCPACATCEAILKAAQK